MKFRFGMMVCLVLLLMVSVIPAVAQDALWSIYVFNSDTKTLLRVYEDGTTRPYDLGLENENQFINNSVSISPDGRLAVFCVIQTDVTPQVYTLHIRDIEMGNGFEIIYDNVADCRIGGFNADGSQVSIGLITRVDSGGIMMYDNQQYVWRVAIVDTTTGAIVNEYTSQNSSAPVVNFSDAPVALITLPEAIENDRLVFRAVPFIGMEVLNMDGFIWEFATNTVTAFPEVGLFGSDYSAQIGEVVYPLLDESRAYVTALGIIPPYNAVNLQSLMDTPAREVYYNGEWAVSGVQFINNGAQFMVSLLPSMEIDFEVYPGLHFALMSRDGSVIDFYIQGNFANFGQSPDGIVATWSESMEAPFVQHFGLLQNDGSLVEFAQYEYESNYPLLWEVVGTSGE